MTGTELSVAIYAAAAAALVGLALYGFFASRHALRAILALNILGAGVFLLLVAVARRAPGEAPDPVPHAMVLTGIVVAVSATAFALVVLRRLFDATGSSALGHDEPG